MTGPKRLWSARVSGSKVVRLDSDVFGVLQKIAIASGMQTATPAQVLRKVFSELGLMENSDGEREILQDGGS